MTVGSGRDRQVTVGDGKWREVPEGNGRSRSPTPRSGRLVAERWKVVSAEERSDHEATAAADRERCADST